MNRTPIILLLLLSGCLQQPIPPSWDVTVNLPVTTKTVLMRDITSGTLPPDSILLFEEGYDVDTIQVGNALTLGACAKEISLTLKDMTINKRYRDTLSLTLGRMFPWLAPYHGLTADSIPDTCFSISETVDIAQDFEMMDVDSGHLWIMLSNDLPLEIDSLHLTLITPDIIQVAFPTISPGESEERMHSLAGRSMTNSLILELVGWTRKGYSVLIDTSACMRLDKEIEMRRISKMIGSFPACSSLISFSFPLRPYGINLAVVDTGMLHLKIHNPVRSEFSFILEGNECSFLPFSSQMGEGATNVALRIENDTIRPLNPVAIELGVRLSTGGGIGVDTVDQRDTFLIELEFRDLVFSEFHGFLDTTITANIPEIGKGIEYNLDLSGIVFDSAWLYYEMWNEIEASLRANILMTGLRRTGAKYVNLGIDLGVGETSGRVGGDTITEFVNFFPESIHVAGTVSFSGQVDMVSSDCVWGEIGLMIPIDFELEDTLVLEPTSSTPIEIPKEVRDMSILETQLLVLIQNTSPLEGDIRLYLTPDSTSLGSPVYSVEFRQGKVRHFKHVAIEELLQSERLWGAAGVRFFPANVRLVARDKLLVKALLSVKVRVGK
jgi:hypothetical protein